MQVLMEFLDHCPLEGRKLQLVCWVVGFGLGQASTGVGYAITALVLSSWV